MINQHNRQARRPDPGQLVVKEVRKLEIVASAEERISYGGEMAGSIMGRVFNGKGHGKGSGPS